MLKTVTWTTLDAAAQKQALARSPHRDDAAVTQSVADILKQVKERGDAAVREFGEKFDKAPTGDMRVPAAEIMASTTLIKQDLREAMEKAIANIMTFHQAERPHPTRVEIMPGVTCELHWRAIDTVGFYIPGGSAPLFSTLIMQSIPSFIAGCRRRILCTPPQKDGKVHPAILAAAQLCGLTEVYAVGGAQAIAAMAYGTETIPKVDKISGPGNMYVTQAKQMVARDPDGAAIDMPAGPSEVMVVAESSPRPDWIAADLLAQAEHDADAQAILVTTDPNLPERVIAEIGTQLAKLPRKDIAEKSLTENGRIIVAPDMRTAIDIANRYAPEHLILHNEDSGRWLPEVKHAGSVFIGPWTPESAGDYASGTNHVLPTFGYARSYSGLTVLSYMKSMSVQKITREGIKKLGPTIVTLAEGEGLRAHAAATTERMADKMSWIENLMRPDLRRLAGYSSARTEAKFEASIALDANESPWPPFGRVANMCMPHRYPDPQPALLRQRLAAIYGARPEQLLLGRGSDEGIDILVRLFCRAGEDEILICPPTFGMYKVYAEIQGAKTIKVPLTAEWQLDVPAILKACTPNTKLIFIPSPNAPMGQSMRREEMLALCRGRAEKSLIVIDEAYIEFAPDTKGLVADLAEHPNLVILRTMSKAHALAGERVGTLIASPELLGYLQKVQAPYPLAQSSISAALDLLSPNGLIQSAERRKLLAAERDRLAKLLPKSARITRVFPSDANFLLLQTTDSKAFMAELERFGIRIRDRGGDIPNAVRFSMGTPEENNVLLKALGIDSSGAAVTAPRLFSVSRKTKETAIDVTVNLDAPSFLDVATGIGFFDHMLAQLASHGGFGLALHCKGDLEIDQHHSIEDCALAIGEALKQALGDKRGIARFGFNAPLDEALAQVTVDLSGRPYFVFNGAFPSMTVGEMSSEMVPHFFRSLATAMNAAIHLTVTGENTHHMVEASFKATGRALREAFRREGGKDIPSTKGVL